jgi:hypothetical protein
VIKERQAGMYQLSAYYVSRALADVWVDLVGTRIIYYYYILGRLRSEHHSKCYFYARPRKQALEPLWRGPGRSRMLAYASALGEVEKGVRGVSPGMLVVSVGAGTSWRTTCPARWPTPGSTWWVLVFRAPP